MKSTSIVLFLLGAIATGCLVFMRGLLYGGDIFFTASCIVFLVIGIFNLIIMIEKKTSKKLLWIHIIPLIMYMLMNVYIIVTVKNGYGHSGWSIWYLFYLLPYLIPHILSFGAHFTYIEYITKNQAKDKRISELEQKIKALKTKSE